MVWWGGAKRGREQLLCRVWLFLARCMGPLALRSNPASEVQTTVTIVSSVSLARRRYSLSQQEPPRIQRVRIGGLNAMEQPSPMDCRTFRDQHLAYMDNTLSEGELVAMERHRAECTACSRLDTSIRRALLVFRNLPCIQPSAAFATRLSARLQHVDRGDHQQPSLRAFGAGTFVAVAASLLLVGVLSVAVAGGTDQVPEVALAPVVATRPDAPPPLLVDHTFVTSVAAGLPIWPAAVLAEEAPVHFVNSELQWDGR